jgi:serine phosphatase RsbU (regulator of sigma subunit)
MPPMLIYRAETGQVEEVLIRAMPWGSPFKTLYQQQELTLFKGDCVLLMSDGFPEMFNETGEMLEDAAANNVLRATSGQTPQDIINQLVKVAEQWAGTRPPDDDVTFVALKIK